MLNNTETMSVGLLDPAEPRAGAPGARASELAEDDSTRGARWHDLETPWPQGWRDTRRRLCAGSPSCFRLRIGAPPGFFGRSGARRRAPGGVRVALKVIRLGTTVARASRYQTLFCEYRRENNSCWYNPPLSPAPFRRSRLAHSGQGRDQGRVGVAAVPFGVRLTYRRPPLNVAVKCSRAPEWPRTVLKLAWNPTRADHR